MARSLEIHERPAIQRRIELAQRIGLGVLALMLVAALLGLFGLGGPLSDARATQGNDEVTYPRFARYLAPTQLEVAVDRATADTVTLVLQGDHARHFHVEDILPQPVHEATTGDATVYTFAAVPGRPHRIRLSGQMESVGHADGTVRIDDGRAIPIDTFVYP